MRARTHTQPVKTPNNISVQHEYHHRVNNMLRFQQREMLHNIDKIRQQVKTHKIRSSDAEKNQNKKLLTQAYLLQIGLYIAMHSLHVNHL